MCAIRGEIMPQVGYMKKPIPSSRSCESADTTDHKEASESPCSETEGSGHARVTSATSSPPPEPAGDSLRDLSRNCQRVGSTKVWLAGQEHEVQYYHQRQD
eukprot:g20230.t1